MRVKQVIQRTFLYGISGLMPLMIPLIARAQNYGEGAFGQCSYQTCNFHLGPITLPATGATIYWAVSLILLIAGVMWLFLLRRKRKKQLATLEETS